MKRWLLLMAVTLLPGLTSLPAHGAAALRITAYINVTSGCQEPTVQLLQRLAERYAERVALEVVDFGTPAGRARWQADGQHCMTILLNGSEQADLVFRGAPLQVAFRMPPGHAWLLPELEAAIRQKIEGVADTDRKGPAITTQADPKGARVAADGKAIYAATDAAEATRVCAALCSAAAAEPLVQDDFALDIVAGSAKVTVRGVALLDLGLVEGPVPATAGPQAVARFVQLINPFPRRSRPFPRQAGEQIPR